MKLTPEEAMKLSQQIRKPGVKDYLEKVRNLREVCPHNWKAWHAFDSRLCTICGAVQK